MEKRFIKIGNTDVPLIADTTLIGRWEEVSQIDGKDIHKSLDGQSLDGLVIRGYEMRWDTTNENGERYAKEAFDAFIEDYFVARGLNMPVDVNHEGWHNWHSIAGRVLYIERDEEGFYFVVYVPRTYEHYNALRDKLEAGIIQGFSKEGFATDYEFKFKEDGTFDYMLIKEMKLLSVSLVSSPANGLNFERAQEVRNGLVYVKKDIVENAESASALEVMFNK